MPRVLVTLTLAAAALYASLCLAVYLGQQRLIYFPSRQIAATPSARGLEWQEHWITTRDGIRLQAWYVPPGPGDPVVLFFHGNAGNISHRLDTLTLLTGLRAGVLMVSYRGYGHSGGEPGEEGTYLDADAAHAYLTDRLGIPARRIVVFGRSLGAAVAGWLAANRPCGAVILESAFTSAPALGAEIYPFLPVRALARIRYDTLARMPQLRCPVLVVHSPQDEIVPFSHGKALFAAANPPKAFLEIRGGHNQGLMLRDPAYREALARVLDASRER